MVLTTEECRWFFGGEVPDAVVDAFWACGAAAARPPAARAPWPAAWRRDIYLRLPGCEEMGIKGRDEPGGSAPRFELKGRTADLGAVEFGDGHAGHVERWAKWSWDGAAVPPALRALVGDGARDAIVVFKRRVQRRLRLTDDGRVDEIACDLPADRAVDFELARVRIAGHDPDPERADAIAWSLAVEAFPADAATGAHFDRVVAEHLAAFTAAPLTLDRSLSYPAWLHRTSR